MSNRLIIQLYRGSAAQNNAYVGASGELTVDTTNKRLRIHDGVNAGGVELAKLSETLTTVEAQALIDTGLVTCADVNGSATEDFAVKVLYTANGILPTTVAQDIGSSTQRFRAIYVDEAYLSTNTLYIGDTPIIGTSADTVLIKADLDQSITVKTTGSGETNLQSERGITLSTSGANADVEVIANGTGAKARFTATQEIEFTTPTTTFYSDLVVNQNQSIVGNLTVTGNVTVNGDSFIINAGTVSTEDNLIVLNKGEIGTGVTAGKAGLQIDRGELTDYQILFDEADDYFKVGMVGNLETLASQEWVLAQTSIATHTHTSATTTVSGFLSAVDKAKLDGIETGATANQTKVELDALGINAATVNGKVVLTDVPVNAVFTDTVFDDTALITAVNAKVDKVSGKGLSTNDYTTDEQTKLAGIASGAQVNIGTNISLSGSGNTWAITSSTGTGVNIALASTGSAGLLSTTDKIKLDGVAAEANNYVHPVVDGSLHVPATSTTNNGKVLTAGATAGALSWTTPVALGDTTPAALGTAAVGTSTTAAHSDHVHTAPTTIAGNAGTATKLETARTLSLSGGVTGSVSFDGSANADIVTTLSGAIDLGMLP